MKRYGNNENAKSDEQSKDFTKPAFNCFYKRVSVEKSVAGRHAGENDHEAGGNQDDPEHLILILASKLGSYS